MSKVRVKHHNDPTATFSAGEGPDEDGGYFIDHKDLEQARAHGFHVAHLPEEPTTDAEPPDAPPPVTPYPDAGTQPPADDTDDADKNDPNAPPAGDQKQQGGIPRRRK